MSTLQRKTLFKDPTLSQYIQQYNLVSKHIIHIYIVSFPNTTSRLGVQENLEKYGVVSLLKLMLIKVSLCVLDVWFAHTRWTTALRNIKQRLLILDIKPEKK